MINWLSKTILSHYHPALAGLNIAIKMKSWWNKLVQLLLEHTRRRWRKSPWVGTVLWCNFSLSRSILLGSQTWMMKGEKGKVPVMALLSLEGIWTSCCLGHIFPLRGVYPNTFSGIIFSKVYILSYNFLCTLEVPNKFGETLGNFISEIVRLFEVFPQKCVLRLWQPTIWRGTEITKLKRIINIHDQPKSWQVTPIQCIMFVFLWMTHNLNDRTGDGRH